MKKFKKFSSVCAALFCAATLTVSGASLVWAESEADASMEEYAITTAEGLTEAILGFSDEEIESYIGSGDPFTMQAMEAWKTSKSEVGAKVEDQSNAGETEVAYAHGEYTVTVPVDFETADADFVYVFDETTGTPTSMSVNVEYPLSLTLQRAGLNTLMGIGTVFIMLIFLSGVIYLFKFVPMLAEGKKKEAPAAPAPAPVVAAPVVEEETDDEELIAVIAAAIAAAEGTSTDGFVVRSIRKVSRKKW